MNHEQSIQNRLRVPQRRPRHQLSAEVLRGIAFRRPGNENVWKRADLLHGSKLWLARKGLQNETAANHAFLLGIVADDLNPVWRWLVLAR